MLLNMRKYAAGSYDLSPLKEAAPTEGRFSDTVGYQVLLVFMT